MRKRIALILAFVFVICLASSGCSKNTSYPYPNEAANYGGAEADFSYNNKQDAAPAEPGDSSSETVVNALAGRKVIRDAKLTVQALDFDALINGITEKLADLGGYVQTNSVENNGYGKLYNLRTAQMVVRVPAEKLDAFLSTVDGLGNVTQRYENVNDVTENYVDIEAKLASLRTEYDTLLDLLENADALENVIALHDRLSEVRYEIESYEKRLRSYDSQIEFSTVTMTINEVERETAVEEESFGAEVKRRFSESLEDIGYGFTRFAAWFLGDFPIILLLAVIFIGIPVLIAVIVIKSAKKRKAKKQRQEAEKTVDATSEK